MNAPTLCTELASAICAHRSVANKNAADREITAELRLTTSARSDDGVGGEIDTVVQTKLTYEDGQTSIVRRDGLGLDLHEFALG